MLRRGIPFVAGDGPNLYAFVRNQPVDRIDPFGLADQGPLGGKCCNRSGNDEWALVNGQWVKLAPGECTSFATDCDGMTCSGGFYKVGALEGRNCIKDPCKRPCLGEAPTKPNRGRDSYNDRRWTPSEKGFGGVPPGPPDPNYKGEHRGAPNANPPRGYSWKPCSEQK
jgi:hypothetical protein